MNLQHIKNIIREQLDQLRLSKQTLNEETKCPLSIQINCSNGTPCTASWQDGNGGSDGCVYGDCCGEGPQSIIPNKRR
jgi:hypothetical protein